MKFKMIIQFLRRIRAIVLSRGLVWLKFTKSNLIFYFLLSIFVSSLADANGQINNNKKFEINEISSDSAIFKHLRDSEMRLSVTPINAGTNEVVVLKGSDTLWSKSLTGDIFINGFSDKYFLSLASPDGVGNYEIHTPNETTSIKGDYNNWVNKYFNDYRSTHSLWITADSPLDASNVDYTNILLINEDGETVWEKSILGSNLYAQGSLVGGDIYVSVGDWGGELETGVISVYKYDLSGKKIWENQIGPIRFSYNYFIANKNIVLLFTRNARYIIDINTGIIIDTFLDSRRFFINLISSPDEKNIFLLTYEGSQLLFWVYDIHGENTEKLIMNFDDIKFTQREKIKFTVIDSKIFLWVYNRLYEIVGNEQ